MIAIIIIIILLLIPTIGVLTYLYIQCKKSNEKFRIKDTIACDSTKIITPKLPNVYGNIILSGLPKRTVSPSYSNRNCYIKYDSCFNTKTDFKMMFNGSKTYDIKAKVRGHSSSTWEKFGITLHLEKKESLDPIFKPAKKYILYAPYFELARILNPVTYYLSNQMNLPAPVMMPIQLWIDEKFNGWPNSTQEWNNIAYNQVTPEYLKCKDSYIKVQGGDSGYRGLYWLSSPVDKHLLNLKDGDYLIQWDRGDCPKDDSSIINSYKPWVSSYYIQSRPLMAFPDPDDDKDKKSINKLGSILTNFVDSLFGEKPSNNYKIPINQEPENDDVLDMIDMESWSKYFIISELAKSVDGWMFSTYMYIKNNKIFLGPPWDYNEAFGTCTNYDVCRDGGNVNTWAYATQYVWWGPENERFAMPQIIARLMCFDKWRTYLFNKYRELRKGVLSYENLYQVSDVFHDLVKPLGGYDAERWPERLGWKYSSDKNYLQNNVDDFKYWINLRIQWLDKNMRNGPPINTYTGSNWKELYSWPVCKWDNNGCDVKTDFIVGADNFKQLSSGVFKAWWPYIKSNKEYPLNKPVW